MKTFLATTLAALTVFGAVAATSVEAQAGQRHRGVDPGAAVAIGIIGLAAGAIIAGAANGAHAAPYAPEYGHGGYDDGYGGGYRPYAGHGYAPVGYDRPHRKKRCWTQDGYDQDGNYVERLICEKRYR
jgi:hypothetical protein